MDSTTAESHSFYRVLGRSPTLSTRSDRRTTQAHFDHAGGFAELKRATAARLWVSEQLATLKALPCDIFPGAHLSYYDGAKKIEARRSSGNGQNPFVDPAGDRAFIARAERRFNDLLSR